MGLRLLAAAFAALSAPALAQEAAPYLDDRSTPEAVISSFYNAISRNEYARAWSYYQDGEGVPAFDAFVEGYADTASVSVSFGQSAQEGAAGSTYWTLPVSLDATGTNARIPTSPGATRSGSPIPRFRRSRRFVRCTLSRDISGGPPGPDPALRPRRATRERAAASMRARRRLQ
ncbi:MAG TPA: hypothetical protein VG757_09085 [Devosia sp.]|nr:hypothetical protein [Devosia sp.]